MKKILILLLVLLVSNHCVFASSYLDKQIKEAKKNEKYQTVKIHTQSLDNIKLKGTIEGKYKKEIKDPKLIQLSEVIPIDDNLYKQKLANDEKIYEKDVKPVLSKKMSQSIKEPVSADLYKIYRIAERIIRANNLQHMNWRIALEKETETVNAYATSADLIIINTALYDSFYNNDDALAMVIAHEMSHNLLGHIQRRIELINKYNKTDALAESTHSTIIGLSNVAFMKYIYNEMRDMELMADTEGLVLMAKAGYSPENGTAVFKFFQAEGELKKFFETHPIASERLKIAKENISLASPYWADEGRVNIYNSNVLPVKRSSDKVSIVILADNNLKDYYAPETVEQKLTRLAYMNYRNGNMRDAAKYFGKLSNISDSFTPFLYLSYANEYLYKQTQDNKYKKRAKNAAKKAKSLQSNNEFVKEQIKSVKSL